METFEQAKETNSKTYRTVVYKPGEDGGMRHRIAGINEAIMLIQNEGWELSPAKFTKDETLVHNIAFNEASERIARDVNMCLNIDTFEDKKEIEKLLERMFGVKVRSDMKIENMRKRIKKLANEKGIFDGAESN